MSGAPTGWVPVLIGLSYLFAAALFIIGLKRLSSPATARSGNQLGAMGMLIAVVVTLLHWEIVSFTWIIVGVIAGTLIGAVLARTVKMTAMPQMVALLNGFGGAASALVAGDEYLRFAAGGAVAAPLDVQTTIMLSVIIGGVAFSGSLVAFAKLQELLTGRPIVFPLAKLITGVLFAATIALAGYLVVQDADLPLYAMLNAAALVLGVLLVIPIGGADMPVVIALLNSYSGLAAAMTGFVLNNNMLIIAGALVGASGLILTRIMCQAMNRSLANVLFGAFGAEVTTVTGASADGKVVRDISAEDAAILLGYARSVIFVPGYGLAVSQAQHQVRELADHLQEKGVNVKYAIHPVAGRMPGHMNVLLAEANVPYPQLVEMERINAEFDRADVAVVIGANDVVNPAARHDRNSPIYGMPIIDADHAQTVIVMKRSMKPGFAGIDNELFYNERTRMLFGDARESLTKLIQEVKVGV